MPNRWKHEQPWTSERTKEQPRKTWVETKIEVSWHNKSKNWNGNANNIIDVDQNDNDDRWQWKHTHEPFQPAERNFSHQILRHSSLAKYTFWKRKRKQNGKKSDSSEIRPEHTKNNQSRSKWNWVLRKMISWMFAKSINNHQPNLIDDDKRSYLANRWKKVPASRSNSTIMWSQNSISKSRCWACSQNSKQTS